MECTPAELSLVETAAVAITRLRRPKLNTVCAAVLDGAGDVWLGLDLVSRMSSVCAEPSALAAAHLNGSTDIRSIVAVCFTPDLSETIVISPCGACRERIWYHAPNARVVLPC